MRRGKSSFLPARVAKLGEDAWEQWVVTLRKLIWLKMTWCWHIEREERLGLGRGEQKQERGRGETKTCKERERTDNTTELSLGHWALVHSPERSTYPDNLALPLPITLSAKPTQARGWDTRSGKQLVFNEYLSNECRVGGWGSRWLWKLKEKEPWRGNLLSSAQLQDQNA